jgi:uncharacterized membrane protein YcjF (UPF0283 family)
MINALFPNFHVVTPSGKGIGAILLLSGWDGDFYVGQDLQRIVMLNKVLEVMNDAQTLLGNHDVDESNVHGDALTTSIKERNEKDMKEQGVNTVHDISNDFILWHLPFKIHEEIFDIQGQELDKIFVESRENNTNGLITSWAYIFF